MTAQLCALISSVHLPDIFPPSTNLCHPAVVNSFLTSLITVSAACPLASLLIRLPYMFLSTISLCLILYNHFTESLAAHRLISTSVDFLVWQTQFYTQSFRTVNWLKSLWVRAYEDTARVRSCNLSGRRGTFYIQ